MTVRLPALFLVAAALSACADADAPGAGAAVESVVAPVVDAADAPPTLEEIVADPAARLAEARVERTATGFRVTTAWVIDTPRPRDLTVIATSDDGFATVSYEKGTDAAYAEAFPFHDDPRPGPPNDDNYLLQPVPVLDTGGAEGTSAYVMGGDGSTYLSFERVARSTDGGASWELFDVRPLTDAFAYITRAVGLADGRLLALVPGFSNDRSDRPSDDHHGLWVSDGADWSTYAPFEPDYSPALTTPPSGGAAIVSLEARSSPAGGVVWSITWDGRLYASTDDARTFTEIPAR